MDTVKFAFILMGKEYHPRENHVKMSNIFNDTSVFGVSSIEEACQLAARLSETGYQCIELCGAFGEKGAAMVKEAAGAQMAVGYVIHTPDQDALFDKLFS